MNFRLLIIFLSFVAGNICIAQSNPFAISQAGLDYLTGQALFEKTWVSAPSSTRASDGLGPLYNARSCAQCHENAGRGKPEVALIFRVDDEYYGKQLQTRAVAGLPAETQITISYSSRIEVLSDFDEILLYQPHYQFLDMLTEPFPFSPRLAPSLAGVGVLETIPLTEILAKADPQDGNGDGISGRAGLGRFGWKADVINLEQQTGLALSVDLGISSELFPNPEGDCTALQGDCLSRSNGASGQDQNLEMGQAAFSSLLSFLRNIPLPAINDSNRSSNSGKAVFENIGCMSCHQTGYVQGSINPYSDLLLHDMGNALADTLDDELSKEWRTPPLWGLSAYQQAAEQYYLHDGRARSLLEAILWHGGEAESAKQAFAALSKTDREDLISFLQGI
ncbi:MAG: thiol oxidoreductase [SAR86 cluster bacterium]|uniref:Thiol oxidoreductase n=1 Tax=SAR86 cluster bacterium TaxID=2030880 RepID=A0A2A5CD10_9GAMM|nr:c-type cytochrome [Gammaproteobacteria bacterium AH-315-E17]PCJ41764.1 MAG: thiol oxidoreductase [SAR86 cluster bacterium]